MLRNKWILLVCYVFSAVLTQGQIIGGFCAGGVNNSAGANISCGDDQIDNVAIAAAHLSCAKPPSSLDAFDIGARAFASCSNQPVENTASVQATISGVQALATATATSLFYKRHIHKEIRGGDCQGNAPLLLSFDDPQGCNPPPPAPPIASLPPPSENPCWNPTVPGFGDGSDPPPQGCSASPIIIDTEGEGFHLTSAQDGVRFDIRGDGHPVQIAWTAFGSHNAFLVLDRSGNGKIENGKELFGNFAAQPQSTHPNGFLALAEFDRPENGGNSDGVIDENDIVFSQLRLWIDENHDGISQPSELFTLPELGIFCLGLSYRQSPITDEFGNQFRFKARVNPGERTDRRDKASEAGRWTYDVFLVIR